MRDTGQAARFNCSLSIFCNGSASSIQDDCSEWKTIWKAVRVFLEYVVFLHGAIGVGLFVVILLIMLRRVWNAGGEAAHLQRRPYEDGE